MAQAKLIEGLTGYFDVRDYNAKKPREQWAIKGNDTTISFCVKYSSLPEQFTQYAKEYTDKNGNKAYIVKIKAGAGCKWFDKTGTPTQRPDNSYLDGKQFQVSIQYVTLNGDPAKKEASGYWANAIMFKEVESNPFAGCAFETYEEPATAQVVDDAAEEIIPF